jgi:hypothetical protein
VPGEGRENNIVVGRTAQQLKMIIQSYSIYNVAGHKYDKLIEIDRNNNITLENKFVAEQVPGTNYPFNRKKIGKQAE